MKKTPNKSLWDVPTTVGNFFVPNKRKHLLASNFNDLKTSVLLPTFQPTKATYKTILSIKKWFPETLIVIIDDATPLTKKNSTMVSKIRSLASTNAKIIYLRNQSNQLKSGALNKGISYLKNSKFQSEVVFSFDDDIHINQSTMPLLTEALYSAPKVGAVCSLALVRNKDKNILTRLQALEYHNFNITKIADNEFLMGPLVMQGMLTAFRMSALKSVKGFSDQHLIEDYDITARLKTRGWKVRIAPSAQAWTTVPENFEALWKQRVRWSFGGLKVVTDFWKYPKAVFQDLTGHILFLSLFSLVVLSFLMDQQTPREGVLATALVALAFGNLIAGLIFNLLSLFTYPQRDWKDWVLKLSVIPEFIYSNVLSLILIGSYTFFLYKSLGKLGSKRLAKLAAPYGLGLAVFGYLGYSNSWGTQKSILKGGE